MQKQINQKIHNIANDILKEQKFLELADKNIDQLQSKIRVLENSSKSTQDKLNKLLRENKDLVRIKKELEKKIVDIIANKFSFYLITDKDYQESEESIIGNEVLAKMDTILKKDFSELNKAYESTNETIQKHNEQIKSIKLSLKELWTEQKKLKYLKSKRQKSIKNLTYKKNIYKKKLKKVIAQRDELQKTLKNLKILQYEQEHQSKKSGKGKDIKAGDLNDDVDVKQFGSSYKHTKIKRYRGKKTISPLRHYSVKQKFGSYKDPVYHKEFFNYSVILSAKNENAKVRNVLSGKVVFANDTAVSNKTVIVENRLGIYTIYSHMDKIAPTIKVGRKIKRGYIIGKVQKDLAFQVTQKNYLIDPLQLIR